MTTSTGERRRYCCWPDGAKRHSFSVPIGKQVAPPRPRALPPECEEHQAGPHKVENRMHTIKAIMVATLGS